MSETETINKQFERVKSKHTANAVAEISEDAFNTFTKLGWPSNRHEEWKYTPIKALLTDKIPYVSGQVPTLSNQVQEPYLFEDIKAIKLVFINGQYSANLSNNATDAGIVVTNLATAFTSYNDLITTHYGKIASFSQEQFTALNTAFAYDGAFVLISKNTKFTLPIFIIHLYSEVNEMVQSRNLIIAEEGCEATIIEDFQNLSHSALYNHVSEIHVGANASLNITKLQTATIHTTAIDTVEVNVARDSKFVYNTISLEAKFIRNNITARLIGKNSETHLNGLYYASGTSLIDNHILIDHLVPNCNSHQLYKGILDDEATGVFNGKIFVRQDAQKTNAFQSSKAILLSSEASMNSKPQLEIFADDVKCSHGAAIGQLNKNEIFYLQARGIEEKDAKSILTYAFANELIEGVAVKELIEYLSEKLRDRLQLSI